MQCKTITLSFDRYVKSKRKIFTIRSPRNKAILKIATQEWTSFELNFGKDHNYTFYEIQTHLFLLEQIISREAN